MRFPWPRLLVVLTGATAVIGIGAWFLLPSSSSESARSVPAAARPAAKASEIGDSPLTTHPSPAAQKAGPPDPAMQSTAAAAAENAAKAAADLAAK